MPCRCTLQRCAVMLCRLDSAVLHRALQNGIDDHFSARGKGGGKAFRGHFLEAWDHLVREAAASEVLFDGFVLSKLLDLVMAMAKCAHALVNVESEHDGIAEETLPFGIAFTFLSSGGGEGQHVSASCCAMFQCIIPQAGCVGCAVPQCAPSG